jgi:hypothetical protein
VQSRSVRRSPLIGPGVQNLLDMSRDVTRLPARVRPRFGNPPPVSIGLCPIAGGATCSDASTLSSRVTPCSRGITTHPHLPVRLQSPRRSQLSVGRSDAAPGRVLRLTRRGKNLPIISSFCLMVSHQGSEPPLLSSDYHHQVRLQRAGTTTSRTCGTSAEQGMPDGMLCILGDLTGQVCRCPIPISYRYACDLLRGL